MSNPSVGNDLNSDSVSLRVTPDVVYRRGRALPITALHVGTTRLMAGGRVLRIARLIDEWYEDVGDPEVVTHALQSSSSPPDLFTFWQRLPDTAPLYSYYNEPEVLAAIPLTTFKHWWERQIRTDTRKKAKRPEKRGVQIKVAQLDDEFIHGVMGVFNETPVRRGRRFWHYGKDFETLKKGLSRDLARSKFIGAYCDNALIGFVKLVYADKRFVNPGLIVSKLEFRNKYVNNALIAKAVEICTDDGIPYLTYTHWRRGSQAEFLARHGFVKTIVPRYWIPLTRRGAFGLKFGLHRQVRDYLPDPVLGFLLNVRQKVNNARYGNRESDD